MASTNNQNNETMKISEIIKPPVQDPLVTQIENGFEKFADALGQHMTTLNNQISKNVIDAMNTSDNPRIDGTKKSSHSSKLRPEKRMENTAGVSAKS